MQQQLTSLKNRILRGAAWVLGADLLSRMIRQGINLVLTRLIVPEAFGLIALTTALVAGVNVFFEIGLLPKIIQSQRGEDPDFLNTAWTIQVIRGGVLWLCISLLAVPVANIYQNPELLRLLPVVGLSQIIAGFASTKLATANRRLMLKPLVLIDVGVILVSGAISIGLALLYPSVWAILVGSLMGTLFKTVASHWLLSGERNRFSWDWATFFEIQKFGRWILLATIIEFVGSNGSRLIWTRLGGFQFFGIYDIALAVASLGVGLVEASRVFLLPAYAELWRERPQTLYTNLRRARRPLLIVSAGFALVCVVFGQPLIDRFYGQPYAEAGRMLPILAIGLLGRILCITYKDLLIVRGQTFTLMVLTLIYVGTQLGAIWLGFQGGGYPAAIRGMAVADWFTYIAYAVCFERLSLWQRELDLPVAAIAMGLAITTGFNWF